MLRLDAGSKLRFIPAIGVDVFAPSAAAATGWWNAGGLTTGVAIYQSVAAASFAASNVNLVTPGILDLTWFSNPAWSAANGWETPNLNSLVVGATNYITCLTGGAFSVAWRGYIETSVNHFIFWNALGYTGGLTSQTYTDGNLYIGANASSVPRFAQPGIASGDGVIIYCKRADNSQALYVNGVQVSTSPKAGTAYTNNALAICTGGGNCKAAGVFLSAIDDAVPALSAAMAALA